MDDGREKQRKLWKKMVKREINCVKSRKEKGEVHNLLNMF